MKTIPLIILPLIIACGNSNDLSNTEKVGMTFDEVADNFEEAQAPASTISVKIIKTGGINFQSKSVAKDYQRIGKLLPKFDAYIENENQSKGYDQLTYSLTIRVPSDKYDSLFNSIVGFADRLDNKYSAIEDVTEQFYDL